MVMCGWDKAVSFFICAYDLIFFLLFCPGSEPHEHEGSLRLADSQEQSKGRLEISFNGEWHSLCGRGFSDMAAMVACRELGFANVTSYCSDAW